MNEKRFILSLLLAAQTAVVCMNVVHAFVLHQTPSPLHQQWRHIARQQQPSPLFRHQPYSSPAKRTARTITTTTTRLFTGTSLPDITKMKANEMRRELESYGISTKSFLEKKEFMAALEKARTEGKQPTQAQPQQTAETKGSSSSSSSSTKDSSSPSSASSSSRDEKIKTEMEKAQKMSVGDLRTKLKELGIRTSTFFEKSEFVRAYAEAMVDGVGKSSQAGAAGAEEEEHDASYRDVVMQKMNARDPRLLQGTIIDIKAASSSKR